MNFMRMCSVAAKSVPCTTSRFVKAVTRSLSAIRGGMAEQQCSQCLILDSQWRRI